MDCSKYRTLGALWMIGQGLLTAVVPQLSVRMLKRLLSKNFENTAELTAKPAYLRELRALGIGMAAAGIASFAMERVASDEDGKPEVDDE